MTMACVRCARLLGARQIGVDVHVTTENASPYQIWNADLWECPSCGFQVVAWSPIQKAVSYHHEKGFATALERVYCTINGRYPRLGERP